MNEYNQYAVSGLAGGPCAPAKSYGEVVKAISRETIPQALDAQEKALEELHGLIYSLEDRLSVVMGLREPEPSEIGAPPPTSPDIMARTHQNRIMISNAGRRLQSILNRLHL